MRLMDMERTKAWFSKYEGKVELKDSAGRRTGEYRVKYGKPRKFRPTASTASGNSWADLFGIGVKCDRVLKVDEVGLGMDEATVLWLDSTPAVDPDGSLSLDSYGNLLVPFDHEVVLVSETRTSTSIAAKKVKA